LAGVDVDDLDGGKAAVVADRSVFRGPEPKLVKSTNFAEAGKAVSAWARSLLDAGFSTHEICFTPTQAEVISALESAGLPTLELKPRERDPGNEEPGIRYRTKKRIKGLEFRAVGLLLTEEGEDSVAEKFANYVAATRARENLLVIQIDRHAAA
jgi:superfamily I DNA/RNA helicase